MTELCASGVLLTQTHHSATVVEFAVIVYFFVDQAIGEPAKNHTTPSVHLLSCQSAWEASAKAKNWSSSVLPKIRP